MIEIHCPRCHKRFYVLPLESTGWCSCGMDYEIIRAYPGYDATPFGPLGYRIIWTEDPAYP